jgi:cellulose synthase/poly-beta-1,6-N-acetylglucosamine synthase-like glycosyltransferase/peptidoglycan/xylan/chitin deacetylase (PgdA/CDA1 family)
MVPASIPPVVVDASDEDGAIPVRPVFLDAAGVRWTRLRTLASVVAFALLGLGALFGLSFLSHRSAAAGHSPRMDLGAATTRAIAMAYVPSAPLGLDPALSRPPATDPWGPRAPAITRRLARLDPDDEKAMLALRRRGSALTDVVLEGLRWAGPEVSVAGDVSPAAIDAVRAEGARVLLAVDGPAEGGPNAADMTSMSNDAIRRGALAEELARRARELHADGLVLELPEDDDEDPDGDARRGLLQAVRARLAPAQTLAVSVDADFSQDALRGEAPSVDLVLITLHRDEADNLPPGPGAARDWVERALGAAVEVLGPDKIVPMLPLRSLSWSLAGGREPSRTTTWAEVLTKAALAKASPRWVESLGYAVAVIPGRDGLQTGDGLVDSAGTEPDAWLVWLADAASFTDELALSRSRGIPSVGLDDLGDEDPRIWQVLGSASRGPELVRRALVEVTPPDTWQTVGEGVEMRVRTDVRSGHCTVAWTARGLVATERYDVLPTQVTIERRAPAPRGRVALTFDDGPDPEFTPAILDLLGQYGVKATFFMIGSRVERDPELVRRLVAEGHETGNHSFSHPDFGRIANRNADLEIRATNLLLASVTGRSTLLFRPPFRADDTPQTQEDLLGIQSAMRNGMTTVVSTIDPRDWERPGSAAIVEHVLGQAEVDGSGVALLHDGGGDRSQTVQALRSILPGLRDRGFTFVQVHDLFGTPSIDRTNPPIPTLFEVRANQAVWWGGTWAIRVLRAIAVSSLLFVALRFGSMLLLSLLHYGLSRRRSPLLTATDTSSAWPPVSVVVPAYNEERVIVRTIESVLASRGVSLEVIVVDDGSTDDTGGMIERSFARDPRVKYVRLGNGGKARALNYGFSRASHPIVVALDADTLFLPDTIARLVDSMRDPRLAAVAGRAVVGNVRGFIARCQAMEYVCGQAIERRAWAALGVVSVVPGAVGAWRRDAVLMVGGFARDTLAEDSDLTLALQVLGWRIGYAPDAVALTEAPETVRALLKQRFRWTFGVLQTLWKHRGGLVSPSAVRPTVRWLLLPTVLTCHLGVPLLAPLVDLAGLLAVCVGYGRELIPYGIAMFCAELLLTLAAMVMDRASPRIASDWLLQRLIYRWILFFALVRAIGAALRGGAVGWNKLARTGSVRVAKAAVA